jgi:hypothetical protein
MLGLSMWDMLHLPHWQKQNSACMDLLPVHMLIPLHMAFSRGIL